MSSKVPIKNKSAHTCCQTSLKVEILKNYIFFSLLELCKWIISGSEKKRIIKELKIDRENECR